MYKWLFIFLLIPGVLLATGDQLTGSFTITGADATEDSYIDANATTSNYGSIGRMWIGEILNREREAIVEFNGVIDSMGFNTCDSATLMVVCCNAATTTSNWVFLFASRRNILESGVTWDYYINSELSWTTAGAYSSISDFYNMKIDSFYEADVAASDTLYLNVKPVFDSGWFTGSNSVTFIFRHVEVTNNDFLTLYSSDTTIADPTLYVEWTEGNRVGSPSCGDASNFGANDWYSYAKYTMLSYDATLDSMQFRLDDDGTAGDTAWPGVYRAYGDSTVIAHGDSVLTAANSACAWYSADFPSHPVLKADSAYFWGVLIDEDPNTWNYCTIGGGASGDCHYGTAAAPPANLQGSTANTLDYCPCFIAYLTEIVSTDVGARVIIIGSCLDGEYIHENGKTYRRIGDGVYRSITDLVFGG